MNSKTNKKCRILLAEDDKDMREMLARALRRAGYDVEECSDGMKLLDHLAAGLFLNDTDEVYDLIISDICMPGVSGMEVLEDLYKLQKMPPTILITAFGDELTHLQAELYGALIIDKPFNVDALIATACEIIPPA